MRLPIITAVIIACVATGLALSALINFTPFWIWSGVLLGMAITGPVLAIWHEATRN